MVRVLCFFFLSCLESPGVEAFSFSCGSGAVSSFRLPFSHCPSFQPLVTFPCPTRISFSFCVYNRRVSKKFLSPLLTVFPKPMFFPFFKSFMQLLTPFPWSSHVRICLYLRFYISFVSRVPCSVPAFSFSLSSFFQNFSRVCFFLRVILLGVNTCAHDFLTQLSLI